MQFHFFKQQTWKTGIKFCSKNYALPGPRNEFSCATITISDPDRLVGHLSNPLYCTWILEMYHIRGQNSHYKKLVWNERIKEGSQNAPKANLTPHWPAAYVIFENVLKEGINIACKAYFAVRSIWTLKKWFQGRGCLPLLIGSRVKREKNAWARINKASGTMP